MGRERQIEREWGEKGRRGERGDGREMERESCRRGWVRSERETDREWGEREGGGGRERKMREEDR